MCLSGINNTRPYLRFSLQYVHRHKSTLLTYYHLIPSSTFCVATHLMSHAQYTWSCCLRESVPGTVECVWRSGYQDIRHTSRLTRTSPSPLPPHLPPPPQHPSLRFKETTRVTQEELKFHVSNWFQIVFFSSTTRMRQIHTGCGTEAQNSKISPGNVRSHFAVCIVTR